MEKGVTAAAGVVDGFVKIVETAAPVVERASQGVAHVLASPRTVEAFVIFADLLIFAEQVEAEGGDVEAFALVTAKAHLRQAGVEPDPFLRVKLRQLVEKQGGEFELGYLTNLVKRHRQRLTRHTTARRIEEETGLVRRGIKKFDSLAFALEALALQGQTHEQVLKDMIPGIAYAEKGELLRDGKLPGKVASQVRREGVERPDEPDKVVAVEPGYVLERATQRVDERELTAFAKRELAARRMHDAGLSPQEIASFAFGTIFGNKEAAEILGRPANQVGVERNRARKKLRSAAGY